MAPLKKIKTAVVSPRADIAALADKALPGLKPRVFTGAAGFISAAVSNPPDLVVVDMDLPDISGRDLLLVLRRNAKTSGMLIASVSWGAKSAAEISSGFDTGADEYFILPKDSAMLGPRLANLLAARALRSGAAGGRDERPLKIGRLEVNVVSRTAALKGREISLTALEFDMLLYFSRNSGRVVSRGTLVQQVWKNELGVNLRSVDKRIEILRKKLAGSGVNINTVFGLGYIFKA